MSTLDRYVHIAEKRILGTDDFKARLLDYQSKNVRDLARTLMGMDGFFNGVPLGISALGAGRIQLSPTGIVGTDGDGHFLNSSDNELMGRDVGIPFENTNAVVYDVGLHYTERPRGLQINSRTIKPEFISWEETIGERWEPNLVTDNGANITFRVNSVAGPTGGTGYTGTIATHAGRKCLVWKKVPGDAATTEGQAVEMCTVAFTGGNNQITTTGLLGQTAGQVSTTAADYYVLMLGPTISSTVDLETTSAYWYIGTVTGNAGTPTVFSTAGQNNLVPSAVDLNEVTQTLNGDLKVNVDAVVADNNTPQIQVMDSGSIPVFNVDEDGDMMWVGNTTAGDADADVHLFKGDLRVDSVALAGRILDQDAVTGRMGVGGVEDGTRQFRVYGSVGAGKSTAGSDAQIARLTSIATTAGGATWNLIWSHVVAANLSVRCYADIAGKECVVVNASFDGTNWNKDVNGSMSTRKFLDSGSLKIQYHAAGDNTPGNDAAFWTDGWRKTITTGLLENFGGFINVGSMSVQTGPFTLENGVTGVVNDRFTGIGANLLGSDANAALMRLPMQKRAYGGSGLNVYHGLLSSYLAATRSARMWGVSTDNVTFRDGFAWSVNADYNGTQWVKDVAGSYASKMMLDNQGLELLIRRETLDPDWDDTSFVSRARLSVSDPASGVGGTYLAMTDGRIDLQNGAFPTTGTYGSNPLNTQAIANQLRAKNILKAWVHVVITAGVIDTSQTDGFNCTPSIVGAVLRLTFPQVFANDRYVPLATIYSHSNPATKKGIDYWSNIAVGSIDYNMGTEATFFNMNDAGVDARVMFAFYGRQN